MSTGSSRDASRGLLRASAWVLGVIGGVAVFLGLFILFGSDDQSIGLGGDLSWRVGDIAAAWGYGLLVGGLVAASVAVLLARDRGRMATPGSRGPHADFYVHAVVFALVNLFIWIQDLVVGEGVDYAFWVTIPWGIGLVAHAVADFSGQRGGRPLPH